MVTTQRPHRRKRTPSRDAAGVLRELGIEGTNAGVFAAAPMATSGVELESTNPTTGEPIARVRLATVDDYDQVSRAAHESFLAWREWPVPRRGEVVRQLGARLRRHQEALGRLVTLEVGKIASEGRGEVQEMIDMADLAVGMSRQLYGKTMHSERPAHRMYEQWHPLGPVGVITAFNFPVAVWAWNAMVAAVCGDSVIWKPSLKAPLTALAVTKIAADVLRENGAPAIWNLAIGADDEVGAALVADRRVPLVSATGSVRMGRQVGPAVARRMGRTLLELGGNNGIVVLDDADLDLALRAVVFAAAGTAGQRCTTCRRLYLERGIASRFRARLLEAYSSIRVGDPCDEDTLMGPLIDEAAVATAERAIEEIRRQGGAVLCGGKRLDGPGFFFAPTIVAAPPDLPLLREETFAPILYMVEVDDLDRAIRLHNDVPQGLSSAIFTSDLRAAERFLSVVGSDCGIANVNIGTSGAEIGGAFGGEKDTGGGREAGSDAWKIYMRRQTCTINWGSDLPLAQGMRFDL
ncbi:MAG TPA: aldehyde dehydrogenase family protein [Thermoanaerobaculia bacterium]|nr:aldehyde dehydrogenase family protein [Thermoanaerobaculia bacterium]